MTSEDRIAGVAALDQPVRRALYRLLAGSDGWLSRDDAAAALDLPRSVAAFHLDKLADAGVLDVRFERTSGRTGPGAGRPAKLYRPREEELAVSVPERHYDLAGSLLATAIADSQASRRPVGTCLREAAREAGHRLAEEVAGAEGDDTVVEVLRRHGYEPEVRADGEIALANCPFHRLAEAHRDLVCGMNLDLLGGLSEAVGGRSVRLDPEPGWCCVRLEPAQEVTVP